MRDTHRMREKYDLSLDSRQVVSLLIGGIVVLGAVFVLGVLVGKKLAGAAARRIPLVGGLVGLGADGFLTWKNGRYADRELLPLARR